MPVDEAKLNDFPGQFVTDLGATANAAMVVIGHRLGLYRALADAPPLTAEPRITEAAARHIREALADDGTWLLVEPAAADDLAGNLNPVGRIYYALSTRPCVPNALAQEPAVVLGNQAGEARLRDLAAEAGFTRFRRAAQTPFNIVLEARP
jgi:hypothetical protein